VGAGGREVVAMRCRLSRPPPPTPPHKGEGRSLQRRQSDLSAQAGKVESSRRAAGCSLPPCGGGSGGGGREGVAMRGPLSRPPPPNPSPQGGGEEFAAPPERPLRKQAKVSRRQSHRNALQRHVPRGGHHE